MELGIKFESMPHWIERQIDGDCRISDNPNRWKNSGNIATLGHTDEEIAVKMRLLEVINTAYGYWKATLFKIFDSCGKTLPPNLRFSDVPYNDIFPYLVVDVYNHHVICYIVASVGENGKVFEINSENPNIIPKKEIPTRVKLKYPWFLYRTYVTLLPSDRDQMIPMGPKTEVDKEAAEEFVDSVFS